MSPHILAVLGKKKQRRTAFYSMFISSLNSFDGTSYKGLLGEKQYFIPTCTEGYLHYSQGFRNELD